MKLSEYINKHFNGNVSEFARVNNYHLTQVGRFLLQDAEYSKPPYFKKYLKEKSNAKKTM